jgi:hypothetical protein
MKRELRTTTFNATSVREPFPLSGDDVVRSERAFI